MDGLYTVDIEAFAERYFIKKFRKKYGNNWDKTEKSLRDMLERIDALVQTNRANTIVDKNGLRIIKSEFTVFGTKLSAKGSGNRCISLCCVTKKTVKILLVYHKNDLKGHSETAEWRRLVVENYPEYGSLFT